MHSFKGFFFPAGGMIHTEFQGLASSCAIMAFLVIFGVPGNLIGPGSGLLSKWVTRVSLPLPALVYYLSHPTQGWLCEQAFE